MQDHNISETRIIGAFPSDSSWKKTVIKTSEEYERNLPRFQRAKRNLSRLLEEVIFNVEDRNLVRAEVRSIRIKSFISLSQKKRKIYSDTRTFYHNDLIGGRVVCNNVEDVYRFAWLLKERIPGFYGEFDVQDYIASPRDGYRGLHVNFSIDVSESHHGLLEDRLPCEVQIRTRLQDAWAELVHQDIYKQIAALPEDLSARALDLAEQLAAADRIASAIRSRVAEQTSTPKARPDLNDVTDGGLAFTFKEVFGRGPQEYVTQYARTLCNNLGINSLKKLPRILGRVDFRNRVSEAYKAACGFTMRPEDIFLVSLYAVADDDDRSINEAKQRGLQEIEEIEQYWRSEVLSEMPEEEGQFLTKLENSEIDAAQIGRAIGGAELCSICSEVVIDPYGFEEGANEFYSTDFGGDVVEILLQSDFSIVDTDNPSLCVYHANQWKSDD